MSNPSVGIVNPLEHEFGRGSRNWLLHARYVRGEHALCQDLADELQRQTSNKHKYAHFIKGLVLADAGRFQEALERFHSCLRLQPQHPEPLKQVARCLFRQGRFQLAQEAYLEADKLTKCPDAEIYCALSECAWSLGDLNRAIEWARSAVQAGGAERAGAMLARQLVASGDNHAALCAYDHALSSHACGADILAAAGALRLRTGDPRRAFQLLGAALAQQPTQHPAALALAAMMLQHKDLDAALARLKAALSAHTTCVAAHSNLGLALMGKKKYIAALTCLQRAVWSAPLSGRAAHNLGLALLVFRRPTSAFCRLATSAALQPTQPQTVLLIAITLERLGDSRTDAAYVRAADLAPNDPHIQLNLAGRHARAGRLDDALQVAAKVAELLKNQENPDAQLASYLATLLALLRDNGVGLSRLTMKLPELEAASPVANDDESESRERKASLVILPPLVLGYDELSFERDDVPAASPKPSPNQPATNADARETTVDPDKVSEIKLDSRPPEKISEKPPQNIPEKPPERKSGNPSEQPPSVKPKVKRSKREPPTKPPVKKGKSLKKVARKNKKKIKKKGRFGFATPKPPPNLPATKARSELKKNKRNHRR